MTTPTPGPPDPPDDGSRTCPRSSSSSVPRSRRRGRPTPTARSWSPTASPHYLVATLDDEIVAYGGIWLMVDEAHVTTFAVHPRYRRRRIGERLLLVAPRPRRRPPRPRGDARGPALEPRRAAAVREVRLPAGRHPAALLQRQPGRRADHDHGAAVRRPDARSDRPPPDRARRRPAARPAPDATLAPTEPSQAQPVATRTRAPRERPAHPRRRVVVRRDGHRGGRGRPADPRQRRREPGRAPRRDRRDRPRGRGARPPALDRAGARRGAGRRRRDGRGPRRGRGDLRPRPRGLAAGGDQLREDARLGARQAARRRQPPRGPRLRGLAARSRRGGARAAAVPARRAGRVGRAHVPRRDARPPHVPAPGHDRRRRRGRGVRQGGPAARPRLPGRPGDQRAPRRGRPRTTASFPRAWLGDSYDFSFSGLKTAARRIVGEARADAGLPADDAGRAAARRSCSRSSPGASRTRSSTCWRRRRCGPPTRPRPGGSCSAAAWRRTTRCGRGSRPGRRRAGSGSSSRGPACAPTTAR